MDIIEELKKLIPVEIIDGSNVEKTAEIIDLDIAYKLFLVENFIHQNVELRSSIPLVIQALKRSDGKYEIRFQIEAGPDFKVLTADEAKVMRARFLLLKNFYITHIDELTLPKQNEATAKNAAKGLSILHVHSLSIGKENKRD